MYIVRMHVQSVKKNNKTKNTINFDANYRRERKLIPINVDYYLLYFDALNCFLVVYLHGKF